MTNKVTTHPSDTTDGGPSQCILCITEKHPIYVCSKFRNLNIENKRSLSKKHHFCFNCLKGGHFTNQCISSNRCKKCRPCITLSSKSMKFAVEMDLLHLQQQQFLQRQPHWGSPSISPQVVSNVAVGLRCGALVELLCSLRKGMQSKPEHS